MKFTIKPQTIYLFVGPSNCGKSFFSQNYLEPHLTSQFSNVQYISSDMCRRELLGDVLEDKYSSKMMHASEAAFKLLFLKLDESTRFPINADSVIVDTTGLTQEFRQQVVDIAKKNKYNIEMVVFAYKERSDYYAHHDGRRKDITAKHINRLFKDFFKEMNRRDFNYIHMIESIDFNQIAFQACFSDIKYDRAISNMKTNNSVYTVIGDVHGCLDELKELIVKVGFTITDDVIGYQDNHHLVLLGDYLDKGPKIEETIRFLYKNKAIVRIINGNHENFVHKYLGGELKKDKQTLDLIESFFDSCTLLENNEELKTMFFELHTKHTLPFFRTDRFIATHAPCRNSNLGKFTDGAQKSQRNYMYAKERNLPEGTNYQKHLEEVDLAFLKEDANRSHPFHVFGHIAMTDKMYLKNKIGLDTGCVYGNRLTSVTFFEDGKVKFTSVDSKQPVTEKLISPLFANDIKFDISVLEPREVGRIKWMGKDKINYVSGTMSPADKMNDSIESLEWGLNYYREKGYSQVILQKKYMGSRCNVYLFNDIEKCYAVSRNGFKIKQVDMKPVFEKLIKEFQVSLIDNEMILLDGELMPWSSLGKGLIDETYKAASRSIRNEVEFLQSSGFDRALFHSVLEYVSVKEDMINIDKKTMQEKIGNSKYNTMLEIGKVKFEGFGEKLNGLEIYDRQIELFGSEGILEFKPFNLLKAVKKDGSEFINNSQFFGYKETSNDDTLILDLNSDLCLFDAFDWYERMINDKELEGCVIKPDVVLPDVAPFLKVRNENYLHLVYGYDFKKENKFNRLFKQKNIKYKLRTSIKEFEIGQKMLEIPYKDITEENMKYLGLMASFVLEEKKERQLDPRL